MFGRLVDDYDELRRNAAIGKVIREILERDNRNVPNFSVSFIAAARRAVELAKKGEPKKFNV